MHILNHIKIYNDLSSLLPFNTKAILKPEALKRSNGKRKLENDLISSIRSLYSSFFLNGLRFRKCGCCGDFAVSLLYHFKEDFREKMSK